MDNVFPGIFILVWSALMLGTFGGVIVGIAAFINAAQIPSEGFGPWWDNTKTAWILGLAVSFMVPFGLLIVGIYWFCCGRSGYGATGLVGRPFWVGPPKPVPPGGWT